MPVISAEKTSFPEPGNAANLNLQKTYRVNNDARYLCAKRIFDIIVAAMGGLILLIPMAIVALIIWLESPGPAIYKQERLGKTAGRL